MRTTINTAHVGAALHALCPPAESPVVGDVTLAGTTLGAARLQEVWDEWRALGDDVQREQLTLVKLTLAAASARRSSRRLSAGAAVTTTDVTALVADKAFRTASDALLASWSEAAPANEDAVALVCPHQLRGIRDQWGSALWPFAVDAAEDQPSSAPITYVLPRNIAEHVTTQYRAPRSASVEAVVGTLVTNDAELETVLTLWEPGSDGPMASWEHALEAARALV